MTIMLGLTWQSIHDGIQRSGNEPHMDYDQRAYIPPRTSIYSLLWCCIPGLTTITFWSVEKDFCTPCHHSVCKPLLWSCLIQPEWHCFWTIASKCQWSRTRWITSSYGLLWFCACEGVHNPDTFRLSVWAPSPFMLESVWKNNNIWVDAEVNLLLSSIAFSTKVDLVWQYLKYWFEEPFEANMAWWYCFMC